MIELLARAKINLALHIIGKRSDGYHELSSLVSFAEFGDRIMVREGKLSVSFHGNFSNGLDAQNNSILDAVNWFQTHHDIKVDFSFEVEKNIPVQAGLGGGTADCAAVLRFLYQHHNLPLPDPATLVDLGADVPVCFLEETALMSGIGEKLERTNLDQDYGIVLVNPHIALSTKAVFQAMKVFDEAIAFKDQFGLENIRDLTNSMQKSAIEFAPEISLIIKVLNQKALLARMSGSGASVFGLTNLGEETAIAKSIQKQFPSYWVCATQTKRSTT